MMFEDGLLNKGINHFKVSGSFGGFGLGLQGGLKYVNQPNPQLEPQIPTPLPIGP